MDPVTTFAANLATGVLANFATPQIEKLFRWAIEKDSNIAEKINKARTSKDIEDIFAETTGVFDLNAGTGSINIDGALIEAIRGARFDHAHGKVKIENTAVSASVLVTGGSTSATGRTEIGGNTSLKSQGTEIKIDKGASIHISGDAQIKQN